MKFSKELHTDIIQILKQQGLQQEHFHFRKKRGRVIVFTDLSEATFSFFLDNSMVIDAVNGDFQRKQEWLIKINNENVFIVENWKEVLTHFERWLSKIN